MDIFMLAAIFGVAVTLLALVSTVRQFNDAIGIRLKSLFHAAFPRRAANLLLVTTACLLILGVVFIAVGPMHPRESAVYGMAQFIGSRRFANILLGLLFGIFLVFWIRQLLLLKENEPVTWVHRGEAIFLVLLLLLGAFSDQIRSLTQRLTQFSAGGVSLSFEALKGAGATDRGQQGRGGTFAGSGQSADALAFLSGLHGREGILARDGRYIRLIAHPDTQVPESKPPSASNPAGDAASSKDDGEDFFEQTIGAMAQCWSGIADATHEDRAINDRIATLRPNVREIVLNPHLEHWRIKAAAEKFIAASNDLIEELGRTYLRLAGKPDLVNACSPIMKLRCPETQNASDGDPKPLLDAIPRCTSEAARKMQAEALEKTLAATLADNSFYERPYLALLYACMLWRLEDYDAAARVLEDWLGRTDLTSTDARTRWYIIRLRTTLTVVLEDWIRSSGEPPPLLLVHHLYNVSDTIERMDGLPPVTAATAAFTTPGYNVIGEDFRKPSWNANCTLTADAIRLARTLIQQRMVLAYRATQHPDYFDRYARDVVGQSEWLMKLDLSCINNSRTADSLMQTGLLYAEILQIYAEVQIANAVRIARLPDPDEATRRLKSALNAADLGRDLVLDYAREQERNARRSLIRNQKATELLYLLERAGRRARDATTQ